jgi:4-diphosphocytidyl-2-C-methyl-D-erythritol kinase
MSSRLWRGLLPAKINLTLRVRGKRPDGYHEIESLVAFASIGDNLTITRRNAGEASAPVFVSGPFAADVPPENSVTQAWQSLQSLIGRDLPVEMQLQKNLPVASGIGGGSADAAGCLRGLQALFDVDPNLIAALAPTLGADVPVCLAARSSWMTGIGHEVESVPSLPDMAIMLVNPGIAVATRAVFEALTLPPVTTPLSPPPKFATWEDCKAFLNHTGNDLAAVACQMHPEISDVLEALRAAGADYVAMSGSGATCFALLQVDTMEAFERRLDIPSAYWRASGRLITAPDTKIDEIQEH